MKKKNKVGIKKRFLDFIKKEWNSLLYWLMFKNYACSECKGDDKKCNCKQNQMSESKGLGDTIEKITTATGIKRLVDTVSKARKKPCGCNQRKEKLNKAFPYTKS